MRTWPSRGPRVVRSGEKASPGMYGKQSRSWKPFVGAIVSSSLFALHFIADTTEGITINESISGPHTLGPHILQRTIYLWAIIYNRTKWIHLVRTVSRTRSKKNRIDGEEAHRRRLLLEPSGSQATGPSKLMIMLMMLLMTKTNDKGWSGAI